MRGAGGALQVGGDLIFAPSSEHLIAQRAVCACPRGRLGERASARWANKSSPALLLQICAFLLRTSAPQQSSGRSDRKSARCEGAKLRAGVCAPARASGRAASSTAGRSASQPASQPARQWARRATNNCAPLGSARLRARRYFCHQSNGPQSDRMRACDKQEQCLVFACTQTWAHEHKLPPLCAIILKLAKVSLLPSLAPPLSPASVQLMDTERVREQASERES